jgi:hypothetical protein
MDNIVASKLYRKGSVGYVSKSGGMSNELNNIIANTTDGVYEGVAIGGDRYPSTTFIDHLLRYEADPECKILLLLGEVGGVEEYRVIEAVKSGKITKPIVAWAIGTCASMFKTEVQFGHAGSFANSQLETAAVKNKSMKEAGFFVPDTFEDMPQLLAQSTKSWSRMAPSCRNPSLSCQRFPSITRGLKNLASSESLPLSSQPSPTTVDKSSCMLVCQSLMSSRRISDRWCHVIALVPSPSARLRQQVPRDGAHVDCRSRSSRIWCHEHHHHDQSRKGSHQCSCQWSLDHWIKIRWCSRWCC